MGKTDTPVSADVRFTDNTLPHRDIIWEIAGELAYNYFSNSFGDNYNIEIASVEKIFRNSDESFPWADSFKERWGNRERVRNILVMGAGASYDAYAAIPNGNGLREKIKKLFETEIQPIDFLNKRFIDEEEKIKGITGNAELSFENYLHIISKFVTNADLRDKIKDIINFRYSISLLNEIVAHLLKHAFLDVVVNFNFEETLDQAIAEELGPDNYHQIISDGNCIDLDKIIVGGRIQSPVYIKPHGTFSHKTSMRYTNKHYFDLPRDIKNMLEALFSGSTGKSGGKPMRVNVFVVGFGMQSTEFNTILNTSLHRESVIYRIDPSIPAKPKEFLSTFLPSFLTRASGVRAPESKIYKTLCTKDFNAKSRPRQLRSQNQLVPSLGELFSVIWRVQNSFFKPGFKPRSIARHEILSYLFYDPVFKEKKAQEEIDEDRKIIHRTIEHSYSYFLDRLIVEIFLLLNRGNGMLDIAEILKGRIGKLYRKYISLYEDATKQQNYLSIYEILDIFSGDPGSNGRLMFHKPEYKDGENIFILHSPFENIAETRSAFIKQIDAFNVKMCKSLETIDLPVESKVRHDAWIRNVAAFGPVAKGHFVKWYSWLTLTDDQQGSYERVKLGRAITLFCRMFGSHHLSAVFKVDFLKTYQMTVYNGRHYPKKETSHFGFHRPTMMHELLRLMAKSWGHHYFVIDPKPDNPVHHLWESFNKKKVIHTNLTRAAEFNHLLMEKNWNAFLNITETGSFLSFLDQLSGGSGDSVEKKLQEMRDKQFVILCSYENIRQLYPEDYASGPDLTKLIEAHSTRILGSLHKHAEIDSLLRSNFSLLMLPFNQHNHHASIFLNAVPEGGKALINQVGRSTIITEKDFGAEKGKRFSVDTPGSIYFYRRGLSHSIDPIYIGLADGEQVGPTNDAVVRDQMKLLDMFVEYLNRSFRFEMTKRMGTGVYWPKADWLLKLQQKWEGRGRNGLRYRDITTADFLDALQSQLAP